MVRLDVYKRQRENPLKDIAGYKVLKIRDYSKDTVLDVESGNVEPTGLPASDVLYYELEGGAWVCVRPSGTEPKIKFYYGVKAVSYTHLSFSAVSDTFLSDSSTGFLYLLKISMNSFPVIVSRWIKNSAASSRMSIFSRMYVTALA